MSIQFNWFSRTSLLRPKYLLFGSIGLMFIYVVVRFESFLVNPKDPEWLHIESFKWWLLVHGVAGGCALILGPMQFSDRLHQRFARLHRIVGWIYVVCAFIAAPAGVYIEHVDKRLGFSQSFTIETIVQGGLWMLTTGIALAFILKGNVQQHRQWMVRSFGTGPLIFLEVRVIFGLTGIESPAATETVVWICTACSIFVADLILHLPALLHKRPLRAPEPLPKVVREGPSASVLG